MRVDKQSITYTSSRGEEGGAGGTVIESMRSSSIALFWCGCQVTQTTCSCYKLHDATLLSV